MDTGNLTAIMELLLLAVVVAVAVKYIRLPYTVALVAVGLVVGFTDIFTTVSLSKEVILFFFLPPLLFEGTIHMDLNILRKRGFAVGMLAVLGTLISTILLGFAINWVLGLPLALSMLLGAVITPTDPVSVLATFKEYGVDKELSTIVEGESVFNDGIGVVIYLLLLEFITGHQMTMELAAQTFLWEVLAGALIGIALGYVTHIILGKIDDHLIEVLISLVLAYGVYLLAERLHCSGVVAVVFAGLIIGNYGTILSMSPKTRISLTHFWEVVGFAANSLLFLLIGLALDSKALLGSFGIVAIIFAMMILARSFSVYLLTSFVDWFGKRKIPWSWRHIINWAGLRGSIPIALALGLPLTLSNREQIINIVFGVVLLSLVIQGLTLKPLLKKLKLIGSSEIETQYQRALANRIAVKAAIRELENMLDSGELSLTLQERYKAMLLEKEKRFSQKIIALKAQHKQLDDTLNDLMVKRLCYAQSTALHNAFIKGILGEEILEEMARKIDAEIITGQSDIFENNVEPDFKDSPEPNEPE